MSDGIKGNAKIKILPLILIFFKPLRKMYGKKKRQKNWGIMNNCLRIKLTPRERI